MSTKSRNNYTSEAQNIKDEQKILQSIANTICGKSTYSYQVLNCCKRNQFLDTFGVSINLKLTVESFHIVR